MEAASVIIGVGGAGSEICAKIQEKLKNAQTKNLNKNKMDNIKFVAIDTDVNSLRELERNGFDGTCITLTDNMTVKKAREILGESEVKKWFPNENIFDNKSMTEGAGQQRSVSRLAFEYCKQNGGLRDLDDIIRELNQLQLNDSEQQMRFYVISTLAGGTGSGILIPLAIYLNRFVSELTGDNLATCKGFFILSSALYSVMRSPLEQKSIDANAYATVKELSAFMRKADCRYYDSSEEGTMSHTDDLNLFDDDYTDDENSTNVDLTYDYAFLFGMHNKYAKGMRSFSDLKDLVADAVYMQACSPISRKNSSLEDNKLRHCAMVMIDHQEKWLRRFGGIGCARYVYPYDELKRFLGLTWAKDIMNSSWRAFDQRYDKDKKADREKIRKGRTTSISIDASQAEYYVRDVLKESERNNKLAEKIIRETVYLSNSPENQNSNTNSKNYTWNGYLEGLRKESNAIYEKQISNPYKDDILYKTYIKRLTTLGMSSIGKQKKGNKQDNIRSNDDVKTICENFLPKITQELRTKVDRFRDINQLFSFVEDDDTEGTVYKEYQLEYWLMKNNKFIHPNSVRYFLYKLKEALDNDNKTLKIPEIPSVQTNTSSYDIQLNIKVQDYEKELYAYCEELLWLKVKEVCKARVQKLISCYHSFYETYYHIIDGYNAELEELNEVLDTNKGVAYAYVCADQVCRDAMIKDLESYQQEEYTVIGDLSYNLYKYILDHDCNQRSINGKEFERYLSCFWDKELSKVGFADNILDMSIIEAMNREHKYHYGENLSLNGYKDRIRHVEKRMVAPFVRYFPRIDMDEGFTIRCFHKDLLDATGEDRLLAKWLNQNGVPDDKFCTKYELMFYHSFVGLDPYEVLDFLHGIKTDTLRNGRAFRSYVDMEKDITRYGSTVKKVITPHSDSRWDSLVSLADPSVQYMRNTENRIADALWYGIVSKSLTKSSSSKKCDYKKITIGENINTGKPVTISGIERGWFDVHMKLYENIFLREQILEDKAELFETGRKLGRINALAIQEWDWMEELIVYLDDINDNTYDKSTSITLLIGAMIRLLKELSDEKSTSVHDGLVAMFTKINIPANQAKSYWGDLVRIYNTFINSIEFSKKEDDSAQKEDTLTKMNDSQ